MSLHLPALPARVVLQPSSYRLEGVADHNVDILVLWICFKVLLPFFFGAASDGAAQLGSCRTTISSPGTPSSMRR